ncbi:MAG: MFS transporter [Thermoplasmata archaeon]
MVLEDLRASPLAFKVLVASALIENVAFGLIIPYLTIYMVQDLGIEETLAGVVLAGYTLSGIPGTMVGGVLADRIGRRTVLLSSLSMMSITLMLYFFAYNFVTLFIVVLADSFVGSLYMPAANAMIADVIQPEGRPRAYSTLRIAWNVGMFIGPAIGVFIVAAFSIRELFLFGAAILAGAFSMNLALIPETRPEAASKAEATFRAMFGVARDRVFLYIVVMTGVMWLFMSQWMSVLQLYATVDLGLPETVPGVLFAVNAVMVVGLQLWVTSKMELRRRSMVLMTGHLVGAIGFAMIFFASDFATLLMCIVVITVGELIYMSIVSALIADHAPEAQRGIYMGFAGFIQSLAMGLGFFFGMWLMDVMARRELIWLVFGALGSVTSLGYLGLARVISPEKDRPLRRKREREEPPLIE